MRYFCSRHFRLSASLAGGLCLISPRFGFAEGLASYKYEDYRESGGRISVKTQSALLEQDIDPQNHVKIQGTIDAIAGATPNGQPAPAGSDQVVLTAMHDRRKAWSADYSHQFATVNLALGFADSRESDYVSNGWSINTLTSFNQKNTTLLAGLASTSDEIRVFFQPSRAKKRTTDLILGVNQLIDAHTSFTANLSWGKASGYLADPYKLVQKSVEVDPGVFLPFTYGENRPDERTRWTFFTQLNRDFPTVAAAVDASYRFTHDNFGTDSHTLELHWLQRLGSQFVLKPELRLYSQSAADFYHYQLDGTGLSPTDGVPRPNGPFYSSDYRLSELRSVLFGLKVVWTPSPRWQMDAAIEGYDMHGRDGVTARSAYPHATILTAGAKFTW